MACLVLEVMIDSTWCLDIQVVFLHCANYCTPVSPGQATVQMGQCRRLRPPFRGKKVFRGLTSVRSTYGRTGGDGGDGGGRGLTND